MWFVAQVSLCLRNSFSSSCDIVVLLCSFKDSWFLSHPTNLLAGGEVVIAIRLLPSVTFFFSGGGGGGGGGGRFGSCLVSIKPLSVPNSWSRCLSFRRSFYVQVVMREIIFLPSFLLHSPTVQCWFHWMCWFQQYLILLPDNPSDTYSKYNVWSK